MHADIWEELKNLSFLTAVYSKIPRPRGARGLAFMEAGRAQANAWLGPDSSKPGLILGLKVSGPDPSLEVETFCTDSMHQFFSLDESKVAV